jgi:hypothetical protein
MNGIFSEALFRAAGEYLWLLDRGYPQKGSLKMVGDKFMLTGPMRQVLYRGISPTEKASVRMCKINSIRNGDQVGVDTFNVLFTVNNYLMGKVLFISNDGLLRDAGEMRGRITRKPIFARSVELLLEILKEWPGATFNLYLDEPVPYSGMLSGDLTREMTRMGIKGVARTEKSPDHILKHEQSDAICTSDSAIIDHYAGRIIDLPRQLLCRFFQHEFTSLIQGSAALR